MLEVVRRQWQDSSFIPGLWFHFKPEIIFQPKNSPGDSKWPFWFLIGNKQPFQGAMLSPSRKCHQHHCQAGFVWFVFYSSSTCFIGTIILVCFRNVFCGRCSPLTVTMATRIIIFLRFWRTRGSQPKPAHLPQLHPGWYYKSKTSYGPWKSNRLFRIIGTPFLDD